MALNPDKQNQDANFAIEDKDELSLLLRSVEKLNEQNEDSWVSLENAFIKSILSNHVTFRNYSNPTNNYGLSHYHIACITNHAKVVEYFLDNNIAVDQIVNTKSSIWPGYSPLHFTARCTSLESTEILLKHGANMHLKDAREMTPMHILLEQRIKMFDSVKKKKRKNYEAVLKNIEDNERIINMLLENDSTNDDYSDHFGLLNFHIACTLKDFSIAENLSDRVTDINQCINKDSPLYPGYTPLHFAMHCQMMDTAKMLITKGANLLIQDAKGVTSLDIFMKSSKMEELQTFLASVPLMQNIHFSDGKTKLLDCISALQNFDKFKAKSFKDVNIYLPADSPLWPGSTLLHLAVILSGDTSIIDTLLTRGADITDQDIHDTSPLHLAFRKTKLDIVELMLKYRYEHIANPIDKDNLSHLHIACAMRNRSKVKKMFLIKNIDCNIAYRGESFPMIEPGWTPLHTASAAGDSVIVKMLLEKGANLGQPDFQGFTAIHWLLHPSGKKHIADVLFSSKKWKDCVVEGVGLSYLHVACWKKNLKAVNRYLKEGSDIESIIGPIDNENLAKFVGCRPLHIAMMMDTSISKVLLDRGADIFAKQPNGISPLSQALDGAFSGYLDMFVSLISSNKILQTRMQDELGVMMLHVACRTLDIAKVKELLELGVDANVKVRDDSNFWAGYTPLHVLVRHEFDAQCRRKIFDLLIEAKSDVTLTNADGDTPVHMTLKKPTIKEVYEQMSYLIKQQRDYTVNHENKEGASHFHAACLVNDLDVVEKFLQHGHIDVNKPISLSASQFSGCTPLQLTLHPRPSEFNDVDSQIKIVKLLLKNGAKATHNSRHGYTALHHAAKCGSPCKETVQLLIDAGIDINTQTSSGKTAFEIFLSSHAEISLEDIKFFIGLGCSFNDYNPLTGVGYLSIIFSNVKFHKLHSEVLQLIINMPDICTLNKLGRNAIHNAVTKLDTGIFRGSLAIDYIDLFMDLMELGCDIDQQDIKGKTPLFVAAEFKNTSAVKALLECGADMSIPTFKGTSVFSYAYANRGPLEKFRLPSCGLPYILHRYHFLVLALVKHLNILQTLGLDISPPDMNIMSGAIMAPANYFYNMDFLTQSDLKAELQKAKNVNCAECGLTLYDFLSENGVVTFYSYVSQEKRDIINAFFKTIDYSEFPTLKNVIQLQCRKAVARLSLIEPAENSLKKLLKFPLPTVCSRIILRSLKYVDLKNLIAATRE